MLRKYPAIADTMKTRHEAYNAALDELYKLKQAGNTFVLQPSKKLNVKRTERRPERLRALYQLGRQDALAKIDAIRQFVGG